MAHSKNKWIQKALGGPERRKKRRGLLHKALGVPMSEKIPMKKLLWASKQPGKLGQRARFALNMRKIGK